MNKDTEHPQDEKTILLDRGGHGPAQGPLTDFASPPQFEQLEERMIYASSQGPAESFNIRLNTLVAAAADLLSEVVRLKHRTTPDDVHALKERLTIALQQFEKRAQHGGCESSEVSIARYLLCTVIDEAVVTTSWGGASNWSQMSLLSSFHNETSGGEKFFQLLDLVSKNPVKHLPMLELMYVCLSLGFEGKYRVQTRGIVELERIRDALYRQIRQLRGDVPRELSPNWEGLNDQRRSLVHIVPTWTVVAFTVVCLVVMYSGFAWVLSEQRDTVLRPYQTLDPIWVQPQSQP
ncbi:type IVB secretion system protein IcmH/DotU [Pseudomonas sp. 14P_8.1_Bac3]|uniref:type IVB secretion system protein IcmH/DotU n=1 Tax=Pseudomonas sp. 14P_8.1_Bac3 TaxID=2971621 RepID=UPI0021C6D794|nr:type IVB secretion system protein IcmH/DotU [Pseudomonas sp. 14P_8.1_Bac3]MCU1758123.1 type IVB secretion system protein IcmH/DotU [Pseudomonas sp. 14P_8.1_Bac3]